MPRTKKSTTALLRDRLMAGKTVSPADVERLGKSRATLNSAVSQLRREGYNVVRQDGAYLISDAVAKVRRSRPKAEPTIDLTQLPMLGVPLTVVGLSIEEGSPMVVLANGESTYTLTPA